VQASGDTCVDHGRAAVRLVAAIHGGKQELGNLDGGGRSVLDVGRVWGTGIDDGGFYLRFLFFIYQTDVYCISRIYPMTGNKLALENLSDLRSMQLGTRSRLTRQGDLNMFIFFLIFF
jgi:hypothetical protein